MKNLYILVDALSYIEEHLNEPIVQQNIADACFSSLSGLQKLFMYALHFSVKEYIDKRRLSQAAKELADTDLTITEIAFRYQYNSSEVFSRAFSKLWGMPPSVFRTAWKFTGLFPKIEFLCQEDNSMPHKKVDISELYDVIKSKPDTYILSFDVVGLMAINEIGREAGDRAILECLRRIDEASTEEMLLFRIGGDEFALVTGLTDSEEVRELGNRILRSNGNHIHALGRDIPVSMRIGAVKFNKSNLRYSELFNYLNVNVNATNTEELELLLQQ